MKLRRWTGIEGRVLDCTERGALRAAGVLELDNVVIRLK